MSNNAEQEINAYPTYKRAYLRAFDKMLKEREKRGKETTWNTAEEVMEWWTRRKKDKTIDGQIEMELEDE